MHLRNGGRWCQTVPNYLKRFGLATGARKMIDHEYVHAEQSITTGIYVIICPIRSHIGTNKRNQSVQGWVNIQNVFVDIKWMFILTLTLERNLTLHAKTVLVKSLCLYQPDLKNVECIGLFAVKILM